MSNRYSRLEIIESIGKRGVAKLREGKVFIVGCGALGSMCAMYCAASGIGTIGIADFDTIDLSNLQRQLFFSEEAVGKSKAIELECRIRDLNSEVNITTYREMITADKARGIFPAYDFIIDGSDNLATKQMTARICEKLGMPYCIGGVEAFSGQAMSWKPGYAGYSALFGEESGCNGILPCSLKGVVGPAAGIIASIQAAEAIKYLANAGDMLFDKLIIFDLSIPKFDTLNIL